MVYLVVDGKIAFVVAGGDGRTVIHRESEGSSAGGSKGFLDADFERGAIRFGADGEDVAAKVDDGTVDAF